MKITSIKIKMITRIPGECPGSRIQEPQLLKLKMETSIRPKLLARKPQTCPAAREPTPNKALSISECTQPGEAAENKGAHLMSL